MGTSGDGQAAASLPAPSASSRSADCLAIDFRRLRAEMRENRRRERERKQAEAAGKDEKPEVTPTSSLDPNKGDRPRGGRPRSASLDRKGSESVVVSSLASQSEGGEASRAGEVGSVDDEASPTAALPPPFAATRLVPSQHAIRPDLLQSVYYVPSFLPDEWQRATLRYLRSLPEHPDGSGGAAGGRAPGSGSERDHHGRWTQLRHARRRVALFDASLDTSGRLPGPLGAVARALAESGAFPPDSMGGCGPPNHVLVNEYRPGEGIMAHTDGPAYEERTCTISIGGGDALLKFSPRRRADGTEKKHDARSERAAGDGTTLELLLCGSGSLVVFSGEAYINHCHFIDEVEEEMTTEKCGNERSGVLVRRAYRISLTFRRKKEQ